MMHVQVVVNSKLKSLQLMQIFKSTYPTVCSVGRDLLTTTVSALYLISHLRPDHKYFWLLAEGWN